MSWIKGALKSALAGVALITAGSALAATLVVRSNGPSASAYPPGKSLVPGSSIALKAGDTITVLDANGTRVLKGPGIVPVNGKGAASANGISALIATTGARQARTGATRGSNNGAPRATNVWYIDSSREGKVCLANASSAVVWRPGETVAGSIKLTRMDDGKTVNLPFRAGQSVRAWPASELPLTDGARYRIESGRQTPITISTIILPTPPAGLDGTAQILLESGCGVQVDLLIEATAQ